MASLAGHELCRVTHLFGVHNCMAGCGYRQAKPSAADADGGHGPGLHGLLLVAIWLLVAGVG